MVKRTFRLFISSTFSDFIAEREALQTHVFPELESFCAKRGARFQAIDLRWGITEEAQREHDTMRICLEEIRRSQQLSPRPNFAVLLGGRYGWEPVPARITGDHWMRLAATASPADSQILHQSYQGPDLNAIPPVYHLHARLGNLADNEVREGALLEALRRSAEAAGFQGDDRLPYFASATHQEIVLGALSGDEAPDHVHVYVRNLKHLPQEAVAADFIDWDVKSVSLVRGARERLRELEGALRERLSANVHDLYTNWSQHGKDGARDEQYLADFCQFFLAHQKALIDSELTSIGISDELAARERAHQEFGLKRSEVFAGREQLLARIFKYTENANLQPARGPLVLIGAGGTGKSALLAKAARLDLEATRSGDVVVIQRYIGGVPGNESLMTILFSLVMDIAIIYDRPEPLLCENLKDLAESFKSVLAFSNAERPLHLYLDALDQLDSAAGAWLLEWLPKKLPAHARILVSLRSETIVEQSARRRFAKKDLLEVSQMSASEGQAMLDVWLADKSSAWFNAGITPSTGRSLTPLQRHAVLKAFNVSGSALWLKLAYEEASTWASWDRARELPATVEGLIIDLIDRRLLESENHPKVFTEKALAYITAGRFGLSEDELARALGTDKLVRKEFERNERTHPKWEDSKKLPGIIWSRLYFDLQPYISLVEVDGALVMRWFHREFSQVLNKRYLTRRVNKQATHSALANIFRDLEQELRPYQNNDDKFYIATLPTGQSASAALRRVMEQPWQLAQAEKFNEQKLLLSDFGFCLAKCAAGYVDDLERDFQTAHLRDAARFLRMNLHFLRSDLLDRMWPRHRVLVQLALEEYPAKDFGASAKTWLDRGNADWDVSIAPSLVNRPFSVQIRPPQGVGVKRVAVDAFERLLVTDERHVTEAFDGMTGRPLGVTDYDDQPTGDAGEQAASLPDGAIEGLSWSVGNGRWFRWQARPKDEIASLYEPALGSWSTLAEMHQHDVWLAVGLRDGGFASLGINSDMAALVLWPSIGEPRLLRLNSFFSARPPCGIVQLPDESFIVWPAWSDGLATRLRRRPGSSKYRQYPLYGTEHMRGAIPYGDGGFVTWTSSGEVRLWQIDDLLPQLGNSRAPHNRRELAPPWDLLAGQRSVNVLYSMPDGDLFAQDDANSSEYWLWQCSADEQVEFRSASKPTLNLPSLQSGVIEDLLYPHLTWVDAFKHVVGNNRARYPVVSTKGKKQLLNYGEPDEKESDLEVWIKWLFRVMEDGKGSVPHFGNQRRLDLIANALAAIDRLAPDHQLVAFLKANELRNLAEPSGEHVFNPILRLLELHATEENKMLDWIAFCEKHSIDKARVECEKLCVAHPTLWRILLRLALLQVEPFGVASTALLTRASKIPGCPPLLRRLPSQAGVSVWEFVVQGKRSLWICGHPMPSKIFISEEGLCLTGNLALGVRTLQMLGSAAAEAV